MGFIRVVDFFIKRVSNGTLKATALDKPWNNVDSSWRYRTATVEFIKSQKP